MAAIRAVADGGSMIDPKIVESLVAARGRAERSPLNELTAREREVLAEIAQGKSNMAIAGLAVPHQARRREAHQLDLPQARARLRRGRQQARQGGADVPLRRRRRRRRQRGQVTCGSARAVLTWAGSVRCSQSAAFSIADATITRLTT